MTPFERLIEGLVKTWRVDAAWLAKGGVLLFLFLYLMFTLVVVRQIKVMSETVTGVLEKELTVAAWMLVGLAVAAITVAFVIL